jgi:hypothetical protein
MEATWTDVAQQHALELEVRCVHARRVLASASAYLAPPMHVAEARAAHGRVRVALAIVTYAANDLAHASNAATAVLAHIPDDDHDARLALGLFQSARDRALDAYDSAKSCRRHLRTASIFLLAAPVLSAVDGKLAAQRLFAVIHLRIALGSSEKGAALTVVGNWLLR